MKSYVWISVLLLLTGMLAFYIRYERKKPQARDLVTIAALAALAAGGRAVFYMLPSVKPVAAIVILTGAVFGCESGFLTGSLSMLLSNFLFGQGPWTPWQMFAMGALGWLAGLLFGIGHFRIRRLTLCLYGFLSVMLIYGGIMNPASLLMYTQSITGKGLLAVYISGFPMDMVHAVTTAILLWFAGMPMVEKLERIRIKYGVLQKKIR